jgi:Uma2 family endonuclease
MDFPIPFLIKILYFCIKMHSKMVSTVEKTIHRKSEKIYTLLEYLEREERSVNKHEYHNGKIIPMAGGKFKHNAIASNTMAALKYIVKPLPKNFWVINSDQKIYIESFDRSVYPDALVVCEEPQYWENREDLIVNPLLIVEVLSKSTRSFDKGTKFMLYETLPSFREYILIEQKKPLVESWFRENANNWNKINESALDKSILLRSLGVSIPLADIYDKIIF